MQIRLLFAMTLCFLFASLAGATALNIRIFQVPDQPLALGEIVLRTTDRDPDPDPDATHRSFWPGFLEAGVRVRPFLYPVQLPADDGDGVRILFRIPPGRLPASASTLADTVFFASRERNRTPWPTEEGTGAVRLADAAEFARHEAIWKKHFLRNLQRSIDRFEDHELETLLYLRFCGELPKASRSVSSWKRDDLSRFLFTISGLKDIQDALPDKPELRLQEEARSVKVPEPILLPPVDVKEVALADHWSPLADRIPRSCWYGEWQSWEHFEQALAFAAGEFDAWSPGTWPRSGRELVSACLESLKPTDGLSPSIRLDSETRSALAGTVDAVALAGWDFSFQSGTSLLLVIRYREGQVPAGVGPDRIRVFCNSDKLARMAGKTEDRGRSLRQDPAFRAARLRLAAATDETELGFFFFSDPWLTNLLSPRWRILEERINRVDARIRLLHLLSFLQAAEEGKDSPLSLSELRARPLLPDAWQSWLTRDLEEKNGRLIHRQLGGLYEHQPVDRIPFTMVSENEAREYEEFRTRYSARWQWMDPIALQILQSGDAGLYRSRLYVSPISNRSDFRRMRDFVPQPKLPHSLEKADGLALGVSLAIATHGFGGMLPIPFPLPVNVFLRAMAWDFAPTSFRASTWRMDEWPQDEISWARAPFVFALPSLLTAMMPGLGLNTEAADHYPGLDVLAGIPGFLPGYAVYCLAVEGSSFRYLSLDPGSLLRLKDRFAGKFVLDSRPCDLRVFLDLKNGYMLRRKLWQLAVVNRSLAGWRRLNRMRRIGELLGWHGDLSGRSEESDLVVGKNGLELSRSFRNLNRQVHLFPTDPIIGHGLPQAIPHEPDPRSGIRRWGPTAARAFEQLPSLLRQLLRLDLFVSVEDDALFFETDWRLDRPSTGPQATTVPGVPAPPPAAAGEERPDQAPVLDFDAD